MELVVAGLSLVYVALVAARDKIANLGGGAGPPRPLGIFFVGTGLGISQTVANSGAPLMTVYFLRHGIAKARFVAAQLDFMLVQNPIRLNSTSCRRSGCATAGARLAKALALRTSPGGRH